MHTIHNALFRLAFATLTALVLLMGVAHPCHAEGPGEELVVVKEVVDRKLDEVKRGDASIAWQRELADRYLRNDAAFATTMAKAEAVINTLSNIAQSLTAQEAQVADLQVDIAKLQKLAGVKATQLGAESRRHEKEGRAQKGDYKRLADALKRDIKRGRITANSPEARQRLDAIDALRQKAALNDALAKIKGEGAQRITGPNSSLGALSDKVDALEKAYIRARRKIDSTIVLVLAEAEVAEFTETIRIGVGQVEVNYDALQRDFDKVDADIERIVEVYPSASVDRVTIDDVLNGRL